MDADSSSDDELPLSQLFPFPNDDELPLSQLFPFPNNKPTTPTIPTPLKPPKIFMENDLIWAKISPCNWFPAQITAISNNSTASVSLFGTNKTRRLNLSQIRGFAENYAHMVKGAGPNVSDAIAAALGELSRREAFGLMCSCRRISNGESTGFRGDFEPREVVGFVRDLGVCAYVGVDETVRAVRLSAQVNAHRHYVSVCRTSGIDERFSAKNLLRFVKNVAVSWGSCEWMNDDEGDEVEQIGAYRRFVSVQPNWMFQWIHDAEDGQDSEEEEGSEQDILDSSSVCETAYGVSSEVGGDNFSPEILDDNSETRQQQIQVGRIICLNSTEDFSFLDLDEEYEYMMSNPLHPAANFIESAGEDTCSNEDIEMEDLSVGRSLPESAVTIEMAGNEFFSHMTDTNQMLTNETLFHVNEESSQYLEANHILESPGSLCGDLSQSVVNIPLDRVSDIQFNNDKLKEESITTIVESPGSLCGDLSQPVVNIPLDRVSDIQFNSDKLKEEGITTIVECVIPVPSANCLIEPSHHVSSASKCQAHHLDEMAEFQSSAKNSVVDNHHISHSVHEDIVSSSSSREATEEYVVERRCEQTICNVVDHGMINSSAVPLSTVDSNFIEAAPCIGGPMIRDVASKSQPLYSDTTLKVDANAQYLTEISAISNGDNSEGHSGTLVTSSPTFSPTAAAEGSSAKKKRRRDQFIAFNESNLQKVKYLTCVNRDLSSASGEVHARGDDTFSSRVSYKATHMHHSASRDHVSIRMKASHGPTLPKPSLKNSSRENKRHDQNMPFNLHRLYACPLMKVGPMSPRKSRKLPDDKFKNFPRSLHMKFPRDFTLPSKEDLEKKFGMFGPLDHARTKVFIYTGAAQVVFLGQASAYAAHEYVKKRNVFGQVNVRFWVDQHENYRKGTQVEPTIRHDTYTKVSPPSSLKSCLKRPDSDKEKHKVRFSLETHPLSLHTEREV